MKYEMASLPQLFEYTEVLPTESTADPLVIDRRSASEISKTGFFVEAKTKRQRLIRRNRARRWQP